MSLSAKNIVEIGSKWSCKGVGLATYDHCTACCPGGINRTRGCTGKLEAMDSGQLKRFVAKGIEERLRLNNNSVANTRPERRRACKRILDQAKVVEKDQKDGGSRNKVIIRKKKKRKKETTQVSSTKHTTVAVAQSSRLSAVGSPARLRPSPKKTK